MNNQTSEVFKTSEVFAFKLGGLCRDGQIIKRDMFSGHQAWGKSSCSHIVPAQT